MTRKQARSELHRTRRIAVTRGKRSRRVTGRIESLLRDVSTALTLTPAHAVDREIETWLGQICEALDLDRSAIYERGGPDQPLRTTHTWLRAKTPPFPRNYHPGEWVKFTADWVMAGNQFTFSRPEEIPPHLKDARLFVEQYGPKASAVIPMWAGDRVIGAVSFGKFRSSRKWPRELLEQLAFAVRLFGSAIERKQSELVLQAAYGQLRIASRRNIMSELVASLAHEVNQPLGAILSNLEGLNRMLSRSSPQPAPALEAVSNAIEDTKRAGEIIRRVRFMFKSHPEHKTRIEISALVAEVVKLIAGEAELRSIRVEQAISRSAQAVIGDRVLLQQCVLNLLLNAFDAITQADSDRREVTISIQPEKTGWVQMSVRDSGGGIDPSVAKRLFQPFVTNKSDGMGLGLLVTRSIVESHGGRIWAAPNPDRGTTFSFTLPTHERKRSHSVKHSR